MALRDFKSYLVKVQGQYLEMKADLADFTQALQDGYITEEQLTSAKADVEAIEQNYQRLLYVAYLLEIPRRQSKKDNHSKVNKKITTYLSESKATSDDVIDENTSVLTHLREELKKLKKG